MTSHVRGVRKINSSSLVSYELLVQSIWQKIFHFQFLTVSYLYRHSMGNQNLVEELALHKSKTGKVALFRKKRTNSPQFVENFGINAALVLFSEKMFFINGVHFACQLIHIILKITGGPERSDTFQMSITWFPLGKAQK